MSESKTGSELARESSLPEAPADRISSAGDSDRESAGQAFSMDRNYLIRRMRLADVPQVAVLEKAVFPRPWSEESFRREMTENKVARYLVAERDGAILGYAGAWVVLDECHITNVAVAESERRQGIGEALVHELMRYVSNLGASWADLEVRVSNTTAQRIYAREGFVSIGKRKRYYEDNGEDALLMVCENMPKVDPDFEEERDETERDPDL